MCIYIFITHPFKHVEFLQCLGDGDAWECLHGKKAFVRILAELLIVRSVDFDHTGIDLITCVVKVSVNMFSV